MAFNNCCNKWLMGSLVHVYPDESCWLLFVVPVSLRRFRLNKQRLVQRGFYILPHRSYSCSRHDCNMRNRHSCCSTDPSTSNYNLIFVIDRLLQSTKKQTDFTPHKYTDKSHVRFEIQSEKMPSVRTN